MSAIGVVDLTYRDDVAAELALTSAMCKTLCYLANHGGEIPWDWEARPAGTREMVATLINRGLLIEREYWASPLAIKPERLCMRLTDMGRNVVTKLRQPLVAVASEVRPA